MLPYLDPPTLGPVTCFGLLAMLGVTFGTTAGLRHAERLGLDLARVRRMGMFCGIGGILGAHYVDLFLYQPGWADRPGAFWTFVNPASGISSYGGLIGGTLGFLVFARVARIKKLRFADVAAVGVLVLLTFGRAGCASAHDHVGVASSFALAVDFPAGNPAGVVGPHHDLGLYELEGPDPDDDPIVGSPPGWHTARMSDAPVISRFPVPALADLPEDIRARILEVQDKAGFVPNVFLVLAHRPDEFRAFFAYHDALMLKDSGLSKAEREMIVVATSGANNCLYCVIAHGAILRIYDKNPVIADQLAVNHRKADLTPRRRAMLDFAMKVAVRSGEVNEADYAGLREHGFTDEDAWDIAAIAAFFAMSNRLANMTGMRPNDEFYLMGRVAKR